MRHFILVLSFLIFSLQSVLSQVKYYDASDFPLLGKISTETETRYERLPAVLKNTSRKPVWSLGKTLPD